MGSLMQVLRRHFVSEQMRKGEPASGEGLQVSLPWLLPERPGRIRSDCWLAACSGGGADEVTCFANFWFPFPV